MMSDGKDFLFFVFIVLMLTVSSAMWQMAKSQEGYEPEPGWTSFMGTAEPIGEWVAERPCVTAIYHHDGETYRYYKPYDEMVAPTLTTLQPDGERYYVHCSERRQTTDLSGVQGWALFTGAGDGAREVAESGAGALGGARCDVFWHWSNAEGRYDGAWFAELAEDEQDFTVLELGEVYWAHCGAEE